jgi:hypothetical protein
MVYGRERSTMNKRDFLAASALAGGLLSARAASGAQAGPALLTVSGLVGRSNRGPLDTVRDQMMLKHGIAFDKAFVFDGPALRRLPSVTIRPTLEYDGQAHALRGPLLETVLAAAGVGPQQQLQLGLRAVDGYNVAISRQDARNYRMLLAIDIDGEPLDLGGLGPQWAVLDVDRVAPFKDLPLRQRFAACPWGLYHVAVAGA